MGLGLGAAASTRSPLALPLCLKLTVKTQAQAQAEATAKAKAQATTGGTAMPRLSYALHTLTGVPTQLPLAPPCSSLTLCYLRIEVWNPDADAELDEQVNAQP